MKRVNLFLILLIASITALVTATIVGFAIFSTQQNPTSWMSQMWSTHSDNGYGGMGGMMEHDANVVQATNVSYLPYFGILYAVLIAVTVIGIVGLSYYLVYPQIRFGATTQPPTAIAQASSVSASQAASASAYESVSKTLTEDERKVISVLQAHQGKYLQKYIKAETGLSRLQTHRIIARLSDRGIVSLEKVGNTNQVFLADWLN
ncbi:MAG: helix-turn-helix transcriptional regulator [Candidatus Bathyarchaeia archaeon]|jgi:hypothetical protein